jgi:hypothetical protein
MGPRYSRITENDGLLKKVGTNLLSCTAQNRSFRVDYHLTLVSKCLFRTFSCNLFNVRMSSACTLFSWATYNTCWKHSHVVIVSYCGVLDSCSFSLLSSSSILLIISSALMIWRFSSSHPASQLLMSAIVGRNEPFSHSPAIASWRPDCTIIFWFFWPCEFPATRWQWMWRPQLFQRRN